MTDRYAVAISFMDGDREIAQRLADKLSEHLGVFIYTNRQVDVAGTNGLDSFSQVFASGCDLVVILYRKGYGETPWTRVELTAIEGRFLRQGQSFLFLLMLDDKAALLPWFPSTLIRYSLGVFGFEQAVGAIKARALEQGATLKSTTPVDRARIAERRIAYEQETRRLFSSEAGVAQANREFLGLMAALATHAEAIAQQAPGLKLQFATDRWFGATTPRGSLHVALRMPYVNTLNDSELQVRFFPGPILLPGDQRYYIEPPRAVEDLVFTPARRLDIGWCWRDSSNEHLTTSALADLLLTRLVEHTEIDRSSRGD